MSDDLDGIIARATTLSDDDLLAKINAYDPYDVEFARRFRAQAARIEHLERQLAVARTDAEQAVAVAYQRAADAYADGEGWDYFGAAYDTILALAPAEALAEVQRWKAALDSIARNTCCDGCQEAALVARAALGDAG